MIKLYKMIIFENQIFFKLMKKILLAIPCFNCSKQIKRVIEEIKYEKFNFLDQIIFVDNRSEDDTINSIKVIFLTT